MSGLRDVARVPVDDRGLDTALRVLKRQVDAAGLLGELRKRQSYASPGERRRRKQRNAVQRRARSARRRAALEAGVIEKARTNP